MKKNIMPVVVLTVICLVCALLMAGVNMIAAPEIEKAQNAAANAALLVVLPEGENFKQIEITSDYPDEITKAYKADGGYVFEASVNGNKPGLVIMCGIDTDGKIVGVEVITHNETPDYWKSVYPVISGTDGAYSGKGVDDIAPEIVSGATNSSNGVYKAVKAALDAYTVATGGELEEEPEEVLPKTDAEIIALAETLLGVGAGSLTDVTADGGDYVKRVYRDKSGSNYAVYTVVMSQYGTTETETLIHIARDGSVKNINKLTWKTSDAIYDYVPPTEEEVNPFYDRLVGTTSDTIDGVELVTNATNTSTNLVNAIKEAMETVKSLAKKDMPTPEEEVMNKAAALMGTDVSSLIDVTPASCEFVRRVYRDNELGYAVYAVVISANYGTVETETLLHIGFDGAIKSVNKMVWKTSDAMWGYVPPTDSEVAPFYDSLVGKTLDTIDSIELVTNATNTSTNLKDSVKEALTIVEGFDYEPEKSPVARIVGILIIAAAVGAVIAYNVTNVIIRRKKK